ncbi:HAD-IIIC family phosphatase [Motilimonas sp. E26]|uniref:HAD-IIIC family phosphatase n=1 Tax=Motilimonas sp. E26 TaxID=2865674 RepID=UPI001E5C8B56|nr:HAD-IIIC family phosphatase [Motilimonas sp. E26]MCE0556221.1 HAD-IIIC family phosphatase [Motilimonas sp. E26]
MMIEPALTFTQMQSRLASIDKAALKPLRISILRNITLESIAIPLQYYAAQSGYDAQLTWGGFDTLLQDASNPELVNDKTDLILIYPHLFMTLPAINEKFCQLTPLQRQQEADFFLATALQVLTQLATTSPTASIIWHDFELPINPSYGQADTYLPHGQSTFIHHLNIQLHKLLETFNSAKYLSSERVMRSVGTEHFYDWRYWFAAKAPYSKETLIELAKQAMGLFHIQHQAAKKCLVLDCDNTLWGGVIGEDGLSGIQLSPHYPGNTFYAFQAAIVELYHRGVLIALCSKNNEEDVWQVFDQHLHMLLKKEHIAAAKINWQDKSTNLAEIADELNIGIDSLVFLDDSQFEVEQVCHQLPMLTAVWLDPKSRATYANKLNASTWFDTWRQTDEDKLRGQMLQTQKKRQAFKQQHSLSDYLQGLNMCLTVKEASEADIPRVAQQTQKTNQFNLTTLRYSEGQIRQFIEREEGFILTASLNDRFGEMGLVGSVLIRYISDTKAEIDTLLLSCRALGRQVEYAFLSEVIKICRAKGIKNITARRIQTDKNAQTADFYVKSGFVLTSSVEDPTTQEYECPEFNPLIAPSFICIINEDEPCNKN